MDKRMSDRRNSGFSLVETLATVAILVILLGLGSVAAAYYRDYLKITELDNAAREIYMAAENRAVLLSNSQHLAGLVETAGTVQLPASYTAGGEGASLLADGSGDDGTASTGYYIRANETALDELLPVGTIDPALRENGDFYIVYEPLSGCATDVFYSEKHLDTQVSGDFASFYKDFFTSTGDSAPNPSRSSRMKLNPMLGYYGGGMADDTALRRLPTPSARVTIHNEDRLWVEVEFHIPEEARKAGGLTVAPTVALKYEGKPDVDLLSLHGDRVISSGGDFASSEKISFSWVLDSLEDGLHFRELYSGDQALWGFGKAFTVEATVGLSADGYEPSSASASDMDNSLYAEASTADTAEVKLLRHLQNLDMITSKGDVIQYAVQAADIDCATYLGKKYYFTPIDTIIQSYVVQKPAGDGTDNYAIRNLSIRPDEIGTKTGAGLFAEIKADASDPKKLIQGVRLVNATVNGGNKPVGALAGVVENLDFIDCRVYWEPDGENGYRGLLGSTAKDDRLKYQITGSDHAGGLVGDINGNGTLKNCLAATLVKGGTVGGLIGLGQGVIVENSYADCYIQGASQAAGLIGLVQTETNVTLKNVYSAGFIDITGTTVYAGGLFNAPVMKNEDGGVVSAGTVNGANTYTAISYLNLKDSGAVLNRGVPGGSHCYYLDPGGTAEEGRLDYARMTDPSFAAELGGVFAFKSLSDSHPYNLQEHLNLKIYSFPGLAGLPHYGDWAAQFKEPSLVYYEQYGADSYGFSGGNANYLMDDKYRIGDLETVDARILLDGYAVAFLKSELDGYGEGPVTVRYTYFDHEAGALKELEKPYPQSGDGGLISASWTDPNTKNTQYYYLAPLPEGFVTGDPAADGSFLQYLKFELDLERGASNPKSECFYNPHFAETVIPYEREEGMEGQVLGAEDISATSAKLMRETAFGVASVRTPRHLYDLSQHKAYYHHENAAYKLTFRQEMDLDYSTYTGYGLFDSEFLQKPIGGRAPNDKGGYEDLPFNGAYDGGGHFIKNVQFKAELSGITSHAGLFGSSAGTLKNIIYQMGSPLAPVSLSDGQELYLGALVGHNTAAGVVENCAVAGVEMAAKAYNSSTLYMGALAGQNGGVIRNCAAESPLLSAEASSYSYAYVGGFVGSNDGVGQIRSSYAMGQVSTDGADLTHAWACGFAGRNAGSAVISGSYSAMDLETNHTGGKVHSFCGSNSGRLVNDRYLNVGNFTYGGQSFVANYPAAPGGATPIRYADLIKETFGGGMSLGGTALLSGGEEAFPYPTAVTRNNKPCHFGDFPKPMDLGEMGVYYWEELRTTSGSTYQVSLLAANPSTRTIIKQSTLSDAHDDGGVVVDYGYGFYNKAGTSITGFQPDHIYYKTADGEAPFDPKTSTADTGLDSVANVDNALKELTVLADGTGAENGYEFHSYRSFNQTDLGQGLYPTDVNGAFTLTQAGKDAAGNPVTVEIAFTLNPLFAHALAVELPDANGGTDWSAGPGVCVVGSENAVANAKNQPGGEDNPYGVRAIDQLEFINWNSASKNCKTVLKSNERTTSDQKTTVTQWDTNIGDFPYLSSVGNRTMRYWQQSHDIKGKDGVVYAPIAEYYETTKGSANLGFLDGWFGGSFNGGGYVIENVDIQGGKSSCAGLFGVVYNGSLSDIILYSSSGESYVKSGFYPGKKTGTDKNGRDEYDDSGSQSSWYAIGALAGVAASSGDGSAVKNCAVSGYKIDSKTYTPSLSDAWGGVGAGGLLGISNMSLKNCTADATVSILGGSVANDNLRIGGLVGTCQGSITDCYAGGKITVDKEVDISGKGIYVGGLVGGSYLKPLQVEEGELIGPASGYAYTNDDNNALANCYSYVQLPSVDCHDSLKGLYALGGVGEINSIIDNLNSGDAANHGECVIFNCYYLESEVLANNGGSTETITGTSVRTDLHALSYHSSGFSRSSGSDPIQSIEINGTTYYYKKGSETLNAGWEAFTRRQNWGTNIYSFAGWLIPQGKGWQLITTTDSRTALLRPVGLTYEQLAGEEPVPLTIQGQTQNIYQLLNGWPDFTLTDEAARKQSPYYPVTSQTDDGHSVSGKYSYPPADRGELAGMDYPFPTILTRESTDIHVHYGAWPTHGIKRFSAGLDAEGNRTSLGGKPIELDLFTAGAGAPYQELLMLTDDVPQGTGTWDAPKLLNKKGELVDITADSVIQASIVSQGDDSRSAILTVTGRKEGMVTLQVSYTANGGTTYAARITVHVTAQLALTPSTVVLFPSDSVTIDMAPVNKDGGLLDGVLALTGASSGNDSVSAEIPGLAEQPPEDGAEAPPPTSVRLSSNSAVPDYVIVNIQYDYEAYTRDSAVGVTVIDLPKPSFTHSEDGTAVCSISFDNLTAEGRELEIQLLEAVLAEPLPSGGPTEALIVGNTITLPYPPPQAAEGEEPPALPEVTLNIKLSLDGLEHTLAMQVREEAEEAEPAAPVDPPKTEALPEGGQTEMAPSPEGEEGKKESPDEEDDPKSPPESGEDETKSLPKDGLEEPGAGP